MLVAGSLFVTSAGAAMADGNQVIPGSDLVQTETYGYDEGGTYHPEQRDDWRDLDGDSPAEVDQDVEGNGVFVNTTGDPKGCADDPTAAPTTCTGGAVSAGAKVSVEGEGAATAARAGSTDPASGTGSVEVYGEDGTTNNRVASYFNHLARQVDKEYATSGEDDDGHACASNVGNCDDETNVVVTGPGGGPGADTEWVLYDVVVVDSKKPQATFANRTLTANQQYLAVASGTYMFGVGAADAECSSTALDPTFTAERYGSNFLDLLVNNGARTWEPNDGSATGCSADHVYSTLLTPVTTYRPSFGIKDGSYGDNSGSLTVEIYTRL